MPLTRSAAADPAIGPMLEVRDLQIALPMPGGAIRPVRGLDLSVDRAEVFGVVGESGCGKTIACLALLGLTPPNARVTAERMLLEGTDLTNVDWRTIRGRRVAMI